MNLFLNLKFIGLAYCIPELIILPPSPSPCLSHALVAVFVCFVFVIIASS